MEKWQTTKTIYRLPPTKKYPKGIRVYKAIGEELVDSSLGTPVVAVSNGWMFYTKEKLTKEDKK